MEPTSEARGGTDFQVGSGSQDPRGTMRIYVNGRAHWLNRADALAFALDIVGHLARSGGTNHLIQFAGQE